MPIYSIEQGADDRWEMLKELFKQSVLFIAQNFVKPAQIPTFLRKKGFTLVYVNGITGFV